MREVFQTERLTIRKALLSEEDVDMFYELWENRSVMTNVGFPFGLGWPKSKIIERIRRSQNSVFNGLLVVVRKVDGALIGEAFMGLPDEQGVSNTDVKLFPDFWNNGYGREIKAGLVDYLFSYRADCLAIKAEPKLDNIASQKMQEFVGAVKIDLGKAYPINDLSRYIPNENFYLYMLFRQEWERCRNSDRVDKNYGRIAFV